MPPALAAVQSAKLRDFVPPAPTLSEVLAAVQALDSKFDRVLAELAPRRSALMIDQDEIAKTMAQLLIARPINRESPP